VSDRKASYRSLICMMRWIEIGAIAHDVELAAAGLPEMHLESGWPLFASGTMTSAGNFVFTVLTRCVLGPLSGVATSNLSVARTILLIELCFPQSKCAGGGGTSLGLCYRGC